ncbi:MAG: hypothetical protein EOP54_06775 [Sphingobacteriales bacterium]|nr:MAG: hypothetical protein EOP54_06775 [Sphingobacteriales bacterium]
MKKLVWINTVGLLVLCSCGTKAGDMSKQGETGSAQQFVQDSDKLEIKGNGVRYTIRYSKDNDPSDTVSRYLFVIEQRTEQGKNVLEYQVEDYALYAKRLNYYNIEMNADIMLVACGDTLYPAQTLYENNLGIIPENRIVTVFKKLKADCALQLVFNDRPFENFLIKANFNDK